MYQNCRNCSTNALNDTLVKGKIVLCEGSTGAPEAVRAGAVGVLLQGQKFEDITYPYPLPSSYLHSKDAANVYKYIHSTRYQVQINYTLAII